MYFPVLYWVLCKRISLLLSFKFKGFCISCPNTITFLLSLIGKSQNYNNCNNKNDNNINNKVTTKLSRHISDKCYWNQQCLRDVFYVFVTTSLKTMCDCIFSFRKCFEECFISQYFTIKSAQFFAVSCLDKSDE